MFVRKFHPISFFTAHLSNLFEFRFRFGFLTHLVASGAEFSYVSTPPARSVIICYPLSDNARWILVLSGSLVSSFPFIVNSHDSFQTWRKFDNEKLLHFSNTDIVNIFCESGELVSQSYCGSESEEREISMNFYRIVGVVKVILQPNAWWCFDNQLYEVIMIEKIVICRPRQGTHSHLGGKTYKACRDYALHLW